jgi:uncharacterized Zn finger protein
MAKKMSRTWWGQRFLVALESCTDAGRLQRGRSYARPNRLLKFSIDGQTIQARVRGNINPYFGVYEEPRYNVDIRLKSIPSTAWSGIIKRLTDNAGWLSKLLMSEMPDDIETAFQGSKHSLLPHASKDLETHCSCPDWANPCKHVAGAYYHVASLLDQDPFLLFELRGLSKEKLQQELAQSPLGQALAAQLEPDAALVPEPLPNRYPQPAWVPLPQETRLKVFWSGATLPRAEAGSQGPSVPAVLIKKQGDYPPFWDRDNSFIEAMEQIYARVREKNRDSL